MTPEQAYTIGQFTLSQLEAEAATTQRVLAAVPDEQSVDYKPSEKCMTGCALAGHIAFTDPWFVESVANGAFAPPPNNSETVAKKPSELAAEYLPQMTAAISKARQMSGEQLLQPIQFYSWNLPGIQYLVLGLKHSIHHRGQLSAYLRPMGAKVPGIYGPSADEPLKATQEA
jgi:uncharacterized damage-inducible protein DinB